jgi:hypothetical protein
MSCVLHIAPSLALRFLLFSSHGSYHFDGRKRNASSLSLLFLFFSLLLIRLGIYLSFLFLFSLLFFSLFSACIAGVLFVRVCKKGEKKVFNAAADDNNDDDDDDSRSQLVVIFFIPELLLAESC